VPTFYVRNFYHVWTQAEIEAEDEDDVERLLDEGADLTFEEVERSWEDTHIEIKWDD
jgi:hypothetical protein